MDTKMMTAAPAILEGVINARVPGDVTEIGLLGGETFKQLLTLARPAGKVCHGFDSFEGMAEPTAEDYDAEGWCNYPKGKFAGHDYDLVAAYVSDNGKYGQFVMDRDFRLYKGWVPEVFVSVDPGLRFCFVYLDLDHYQPTLDALRWIWPRMETGGHLLCDDYLERIDRLATKAIKQWMRNELQLGRVVEVEGRQQIAFVKLASPDGHDESAPTGASAKVGS